MPPLLLLLRRPLLEELLLRTTAIAAVIAAAFAAAFFLWIDHCRWFRERGNGIQIVDREKICHFVGASAGTIERAAV